MTSEQFNSFWADNYPDTALIQHFFKQDYVDRWFRIHSLPMSKRYAEDENEWSILLKRQNEIITNFIGNNSNLLLVTGDYSYFSSNNVHITKEELAFMPYSFTLLQEIDLYELRPNEYDKGEIYRPAFSEIIWIENKHNTLLTKVANDEIRAFFVSADTKTIIAPYDSGIDFVLKDELTKDVYKQKYKNWLSAREDGY